MNISPCFLLPRFTLCLCTPYRWHYTPSTLRFRCLLVISPECDFWAKVLVFLFLHPLLLPTSRGRRNEALPPFLVVAKRLLAREGVEEGRNRVCVRTCACACACACTSSHMYTSACVSFRSWLFCCGLLLLTLLKAVRLKIFLRKKNEPTS